MVKGRVSDELLDALEKYQEAKTGLYQHRIPFRRVMADGLLTLSCPFCGTNFWCGLFALNPSFEFPIICCGKMLI